MAIFKSKPGQRAGLMGSFREITDNYTMLVDPKLQSNNMKQCQTQTAFLIAKIAKLETTSGNIIWMDQTDGSETAVGNTIKFRSKSHKNNACLPVFILKNRKIKKTRSRQEVYRLLIISVCF